MPRFSIQHTHEVFDTLHLRDESLDAHVTIVPARGALVSGYSLGDREVLYLDRATLDDTTKNVRGGIPVLFPIAGRLAGDRYTHDGRVYELKQHGFARNRAFTVRAATADEGSATVTLGLASDDATRAVFPWDFDLALQVELGDGGLTLRTTVENRGASPMPVHLGFHPYFAVRDDNKPDANVLSDATRAFDNRTKSTVAFDGFDLTQPEVDLHLIDHGMPDTVLFSGDGRSLTVRADEALRARMVVWTLAGKDFVCVEPWSAPGDALNTGDHLVHLRPGARFEASWSIVPTR